MSQIHAIIQGTADIKSVKRVQFGVLSPATILRESVGSIHKHITKGGELQNTLMDPRLGASRTTKNSITGLNIKSDPGNFGHLELPLPVYHPIYIDNIKDILKVVCPECSNIRTLPDLSHEDIVRMIKKKVPARAKRMKYIQELIKKAKDCQVCGAVLPDIAGDNPNQILGFALVYQVPDEEAPVVVDKKKKQPTKKDTQPITAKKVHNILKRISDEDSELMGFNPITSRPEWMMITVLPVPPPTVRPSVIADNDKTSDDDITQILHSIIKYRNSLEQCIVEDDSSKEAANMWRLLQLHIAALIDNETNTYTKVCNRAHRPLKTIKGRHKGKPGRVRNNLEGKRTNHSARTVITADPNLSINEVGVPLEIAMTMTYPERVNRYNIKHLTTLVQRGALNYPGANEYKKPGQNYPINLSCISDEDRKKIRLTYGTIVYRHMLNGDIVVFNRQPSLHKMNMMGHYARILPGRSFRLSVNVTEPYAADFDGDEMNMHLPQNEQGRREWELLALSPTQLVSPQANKPVIGTVQDTMVACYRASSDQVRGYDNKEKYLLNIREFMYLVNWIGEFNGNIPTLRTLDTINNTGKKTGWSMVDLFNLFLPPITIKERGGKGNDGSISILNGVMYEPPSGQNAMAMDNASGLLGTSAGSLFHIAWNDLGPNAAKNLIDDMSRIMSQWFMITGFSVGLKDLELPKIYTDEIERKKDKYLTDAQILTDALHNGEYNDELRLELGLGPRGLTANNAEQFETDIFNILTECKTKVQEYVADHIYEIRVHTDADGNPIKGDNFETDGKYLADIYDNRFMSMVRSGSKGKPSNAVQIIGILGQQDIGGSRVKDYIRRRPLPFVPKDDLSPEARGFIRNSYVSGLNFLEYIYHSMAGRMGVISTSIKTAETGYLQRKLMKRLEDIKAHYDGTVRLGNGVIVQSIYGGDGYDGSKIEKQSIEHIGLSLDALYMKYGYTPGEWNTLSELCTVEGELQFDLDEEKESVTTELNQLEADWKYLRSRYQYDLPRSIPSIINFDRLINSVKSRLGVAGTIPHLKQDWVLKPSYILKKINDLKEDLRLPTTKFINDFSLQQFFVLLRSKLASKVLIFEKGYNIQSFNDLLSEIRYKFYDGMITPGEAVGALAAQSIGEPSTQMTLDAFHSTGSKVTVSGGVPRFKEILSLTKMKMPSVTIYLKGIPIPRSVMDQIDEKFLPNERANTMSYVDKWLLSLPRDEAKKKKIEFIEAFTTSSQASDGAEGLSVMSVKNKFEHTEFSDIVSRSELHYVHTAETDPLVDKLSQIDSIMAPVVERNYPSWVLIFELDPNAVSEHEIDISDLPGKFNGVQAQCIPATTQMHVMFDIAETMHEIAKKETEMLKTHIKGVADITNTMIRRAPRDIHLENGGIIQKDTEDYKKYSEVMMAADDYIVDTVGSNLLDILGMPNVDPYRTFTNDITETYAIYGIEVARRAIIRETYEVLSNAGAHIDIRHIELLADAMTCRGFLQKIDRYGARKGESGPWALASFEETTSVLCEAASFGQEDNMNGVSANVMFGQFVKVGTGAFDIYIDEAMILEKGVPEPKLEFEKRSDEYTVESTQGCAKDDFLFDFVL